MTPGDLAANAGMLWLLAGLVLGGAELIVPGVFCIFLAIAAGLTGVAVLALPELPVVAQLVSFTAWSGVIVAIGQRWYRDYPVNSSDPLLNDRAARLIGEVVTVDEAIAAGRGRVRVGDGAWPASGPDAAIGERMRVVAVDHGVVVVEPVAVPNG